MLAIIIPLCQNLFYLLSPLSIYTEFQAIRTFLLFHGHLSKFWAVQPPCFLGDFQPCREHIVSHLRRSQAGFFFLLKYLLLNETSMYFSTSTYIVPCLYNFFIMQNMNFFGAICAYLHYIWNQFSIIFKNFKSTGTAPSYEFSEQHQH